MPKWIHFSCIDSFIRCSILFRPSRARVMLPWVCRLKYCIRKNLVSRKGKHSQLLFSLIWAQLGWLAAKCCSGTFRQHKRHCAGFNLLLNQSPSAYRKCQTWGQVKSNHVFFYLCCHHTLSLQHITNQVTQWKYVVPYRLIFLGSAKILFIIIKSDTSWSKLWGWWWGGPDNTWHQFFWFNNT